MLEMIRDGKPLYELMITGKQLRARVPTSLGAPPTLGGPEGSYQPSMTDYVCHVTLPDEMPGIGPEGASSYHEP